MTNLLKATSRSFYLMLRVLPARVRSQIGLTYLLVPKGQPEISQLRSGGYRGKKENPS